MSTDDLEFRKLPLTMVKINSDGHHITADTTDHEESPIDKVEEEEDCQLHTPRSPHTMIPASLSCPPPPKKRRPTAACKRKLCDLKFFEMGAREEVESLFRSTLHQVNLNGSTKRKCLL